MKEKLITAKNEFSRQIKKLSITFTLIIHLLYIGYLSYSLMNGIGIKEINIALIIGTALFLVVYLFLKILGTKERSQIRSTKRAYKRFKLITKVFTTVTAIYSLVTAVAAKTVSPFAMIFPSIGAAFLGLRLIVELLAFLIKRKAKKIKESRETKREAKIEAKREAKRANKSKKTDIEAEDGAADDICAISDEDLSKI